jgi:hypothetical protein
MSEKVVALHGAYTSEETPANETVVKELERLLEAARAGQVVGIAGAYLHRDKQVGYSYAGIAAGYSILGGLECLKERLLRIILSRE